MIDFTQQTDKIVMLDKWTQRPPVASIHSAVEDFDLFMQNVRGCGGQVKNLCSLSDAGIKFTKLLKQKFL